ncbi:hypothetical protein [Aurantivibrio plasticivorans]
MDSTDKTGTDENLRLIRQTAIAASITVALVVVLATLANIVL